MSFKLFVILLYHVPDWINLWQGSMGEQLYYWMLLPCINIFEIKKIKKMHKLLQNGIVVLLINKLVIQTILLDENNDENAQDEQSQVMIMIYLHECVVSRECPHIDMVYMCIVTCWSSNIWEFLWNKYLFSQKLIFVWRKHENMSPCTGFRVITSYEWIAS